MEIILLKDMDELGLEGDIVDVAKGYARNYLIPKGIGVEASPQNIKSLEMQRKKIDARRLKVKEAAEALKEKMAQMVISLSHKTGEEGKLYGSVTRMDIASDLERQGVVVDRRKIVIEKPIKTLGEYDVPVKIHPEVTASVMVIVEAEEAKEE